MDISKLLEALKEYQRYNRIGNDLEAYLFTLGEWALGETDKKPCQEDYGGKEADVQNNP